MPTVHDIEMDRQAAQARLDQASDVAARNRMGQFATPATLADDIVALCWRHWRQSGRHRPVRFLEPCVGTGSFFSSLMRTFPGPLIESARGYEVDASYADAARKLWRAAGLQVHCADFLQQAPPAERFNLLITNPPYVRHHHLDPAVKEQLQALVKERLRLRISGLAGLYCYMLLLADAWLEDDGLSVWLIPSEFMDVNYGLAVKEYLTRRVRLLRIHRFCPSNVQFDDALVSSAVVIFEKTPPAQHEVVFSLGGSLAAPARQSLRRCDDLDPAAKWTKYGGAESASPQQHHSATAILCASAPQPPANGAPPVRFGDLFTIKRGLATGANDFFILPRDQAHTLGIPDEFLRPILPSPRTIVDPVIDSDATGYPKLPMPLALLDCRLSEDRVAADFPRLWDYLQTGIARGIHQTYLTSRRSPWYAQEDRPPPPFLCTYMGRGGNGRKPFRFLWNQSQATAPNVYLLLYPKTPLAAALAADPALPARLFAALTSIDTDAMKADGRVYGGGLFKMEPKELAAIPAEFLLAALGMHAGAVVGERQGKLFADG